MAEIPAKYLDLLQDKKSFAHLATIMPDGTPQVTPVWFDYTKGKIRVNSAKGRVKTRNMTEGAPVALSITVTLAAVPWPTQSCGPSGVKPSVSGSPRSSHGPPGTSEPHADDRINIKTNIIRTENNP